MARDRLQEESEHVHLSGRQPGCFQQILHEVFCVECLPRIFALNDIGERSLMFELCVECRMSGLILRQVVTCAEDMLQYPIVVLEAKIPDLCTKGDRPEFVCSLK